MGAASIIVMPLSCRDSPTLTTRLSQLLLTAATIAGGRAPSAYCSAVSSTLENGVSAGMQSCTCDRVLQPVVWYTATCTKGFRKTSVVMFVMSVSCRMSVSCSHTMLPTLMLTSVTRWHLT